MLLLDLPSALDVVDVPVLVVLELGILAGDGAVEEHLLELLLGLREGVVVEAQVPQQFVHLAVLLELAEGLGDEVEGQLRDEGDVGLLLVLERGLHVELLLEETADDLLLHLEQLLLLLRLLVELGSDLYVGEEVRPLTFCSSSSTRCL